MGEKFVLTDYTKSKLQELLDMHPEVNTIYGYGNIDDRSINPEYLIVMPDSLDREELGTVYADWLDTIYHLCHKGDDDFGMWVSACNQKDEEWFVSNPMNHELTLLYRNGEWL